ncbi:restriction endonuclease subunit S [Comamonas testosteroni]|uniref:restriction endonuclease subunit S n=1 Tax=Comamonas testosteroni TaxID=285 RepID=UPI00389B1CEE
MELKARYKQTEVGVIPEDWNCSALGNLCDTSSGTTPSRSLVERYFRGGTINWVKTLDLNNSVIFSTDERVTEAALNETSLRVYPKNTVLVAMYGGFNQIGRTGILSFPACVNQAITAVRCGAQLDAGYLLATLNFKVEYWKSVASSSRKDPNITSKDIRDFVISYPPKAEQQAIAEALSDADALIESLDQLIAKKRQIKQGAMQELLTGKRRLPEFDEEWEVRPLAAVVYDLEAGVSVNSVEHPDPLSTLEPCVLKTSAIFDGNFKPAECKLIDHRDIYRAKLSPRKDSIIISRMNTPNLVGEVGYVAEDFPSLYLPDRLWMTRLVIGADVSARWLSYVMSTPQNKESIKGLATGTSGSMKNISKSALLSLHFAFPSGAEQAAIATILSDMDTEIAALESRLVKARQIKQGMMQELLTGRIRLL